MKGQAGKANTKPGTSSAALRANTIDVNIDATDPVSQNVEGIIEKIFFQYFMIIELSLNNQPFEPKFYTGI